VKFNTDVFKSREFLQEQWQQQPCLVRQGFAQFDDLIEPEILAGLAMEEGVDARIVQHSASTNQTEGWSVQHGPFADYEQFGEADWTLLVQSVNEWLPQVGELLTAFDFLPEWRIDDVMVSFSCEGGGVGPHLDQYDVFIIQGAGRRRWKVGSRQQMTNYQPCDDLTLVKEPFEAVIDEVLEPGDVLYIPAGCPHDGIALEPSLNYSVGFRAPSQAEWLMQVADQALQTEQLTTRYQDPDLNQQPASYQVTDTELTQCKRLLAEALDSSAIDDILLRVMSQSKRSLVEPELPYAPEQVNDLLLQPNALIGRTPGARWLYSKPHNAFYANGECYPISDQTQSLAHALAAIQQEIPGEELQAYVNSDKTRELMAELLNQGTFQLFLESD